MCIYQDSHNTRSVASLRGYVHADACTICFFWRQHCWCSWCTKQYIYIYINIYITCVYIRICTTLEALRVSEAIRTEMPVLFAPPQGKTVGAAKPPQKKLFLSTQYRSVSSCRSNVHWETFAICSSWRQHRWSGRYTTQKKKHFKVHTIFEALRFSEAICFETPLLYAPCAVCAADAQKDSSK